MMDSKNKTVLILAAGTGGHIFPGLAVAQALQQQGWQVYWLGTTGSVNKPSMESKLVPAKDIPIRYIDFMGVRGKSKLSLVTLPWRLIKAIWQSKKIIAEVKPAVVIGFGGYVSFPAGLAAYFKGVPLLLHEQNSVAGSANKWLATFAKEVFSAFPKVLPKAQLIGNPVRAEFSNQPAPEYNYAQRRGKLKILVLGGSLGAKALNEIVPLALAELTEEQRPEIVHQSGEQHLAQLEQNYAAAKVAATTVAFIKDTAQAMLQADLLICRAGATTIAEITAIGVAAILVPFPYAIDDHQTINAEYLVNNQAAWLVPQAQLSPAKLAQLIAGMQRSELLAKALRAKQLAKTEALATMVRACEEIVEDEKYS